VSEPVVTVTLSAFALAFMIGKVEDVDRGSTAIARTRYGPPAGTPRIRVPEVIDDPVRWLTWGVDPKAPPSTATMNSFVGAGVLRASRTPVIGCTAICLRLSPRVVLGLTKNPFLPAPRPNAWLITWK
jgi:hypothetical protein